MITIMISGLTEYEKYRVIRPIIGEYRLDRFDMPVIWRAAFDGLDWEKLQVLHYKNLSPQNDNSHVLALMFQYDKVLITLWNNPLKRIPLFRTCAAIATPDFSLYPSMNPNEIRHNIFQSRWLGCTWQNYGCTVFPTIGWAAADTYDICFSGVEPGGPVVISTIGCLERQEAFLDGFAEMKRRLSPSMIIVFGKMIQGMAGTFLHFNYEDAMADRLDQIHMDIIPRVFTIEEVA